MTYPIENYEQDNFSQLYWLVEKYLLYVISICTIRSVLLDSLVFIDSVAIITCNPIAIEEIEILGPFSRSDVQCQATWYSTPQSSSVAARDRKSLVLHLPPDVRKAINCEIFGNTWPILGLRLRYRRIVSRSDSQKIPVAAQYADGRWMERWATPCRLARPHMSRDVHQ